jgi:uncharacterized protein YndB with AHSA1/START domain
VGVKGEVSTFVDAPPERVWHMVADVTRMGEWSPVCRRCEWLDAATGPEVGARFRGHNRQGPLMWSTVCEVTAADPGRVFEFRVIDGTFAFGFRGKEMTRWRYAFEPEGIGTRVTESYDIKAFPPLLRPSSFLLKRQDREGGMRTTLDRLRKAAEGPESSDD